MIRTGLDRLLADPTELRGRRYALLSHTAAVDADLQPAHLALHERDAERPARLLGPEHGFYGIEQDMVASGDETDPWTGLPIVSLYGDDEGSLVPSAAVFSDLDLLLIDLQDVGARYYTYAATAIWAAEVALGAGCEVWLLDRPNPLGGLTVEGNLRRPGFESFVSAFALPARHSLTLGELLSLEAGRRRWSGEWRVVTMEGWHRDMLWPDTGRPWVPPSPNLPTFAGAVLYPGLCLVEATTISEGRGTTRPFQWIGAPGLDGPRLASALAEQQHPGVAVAPHSFRPQFQKHAGAACVGLTLEVVDPRAVPAYELGVELIALLAAQGGDAFEWRHEPYEFVTEKPAIDLLTGNDEFRVAVESGADVGDWIASWEADETAFREETAAILLYD